MRYKNHKVNIEVDQTTVPGFATSNNYKILGFFGKCSFLSNFYPLSVPIFYKGLRFYSVETAYQFSKFNTTKIINPKMSATESKKISKIYNSQIRDNFTLNKNQIMYGLCFQKFNNDKALLTKLLSTNDKYLEETNDWKDTYWGVYNGVGENNLGKILMQIRKILS